jgi:hypothetical protein
VLTPANTRRVCAGLRAHGNFTKACADAGIHRDSHYAWMHAGLKAPDSDAGQYRNAVLAAVAEREIRLEATVEAAAADQRDKPGDWRAAAFLLDLGEKRKATALAARKANAEIRLTKAKTAGLIPPDVTITITDPADVAALMREKFGQARALPAGPSADGTDPSDGA